MQPPTKPLFTRKQPPTKLKNVDWNQVTFQDRTTKQAIELFWWCDHHAKPPFKKEIWAWFDFESFFHQSIGLLGVLEQMLIDSHSYQSEINYLINQLSTAIEKHQKTSLAKKIALVDKVIHFCHLDWRLLDLAFENPTNIEILRKEFEEKYL